MKRKFNFLLLVCLLCSSCSPNIISRQNTGIPASGIQVTNLVAFARLYGYIRFFHPSDQASLIDWDNAAIDGVIAVRNASGTEELAKKLEDFFKPIAPTLRVFPSSKQINLPKEIAKPIDGGPYTVTEWKYEGYDSGGAQDIYKSERIGQSVKNVDELPGELKPWVPYNANLVDGVSAIIPLALFKDNNGTLPHSQIPQTYLNHDLSAKDSQARRLAGIVIIWNMYQHFYPYWDVVDVDWKNVLEQTLEEALTIKNEVDYYDLLQRLVAKANDGHGNVIPKVYQEIFSPPIMLSWVEDKVIILDVQGDEKGKVGRGDQVISVEGIPVLQFLSKKEDEISAATLQWRRYKALSYLLSGLKNTSVNLEIKTLAGENKSINLERSMQGISFNQEERPLPVTEIEPGIWYIDLTKIDDNRFNDVLEKLVTAKGIVFDLRGYPSTSTIFIEHIIRTQVSSPKFLVPIYSFPDQKSINYKDVSWNLEPQEPTLNAKIVFLTDAREISYAETCLGIIEYYKLGEIVGEPTAGTNGNIARMQVLNDYELVWTAMKVLNQEGSQHHGVGINPTVTLLRTVQGISEGRDEQVEKAISIIHNNLR